MVENKVNNRFYMEEICLNITDGKHGNCKDEPNSGYFFISVKDINNGKINYDNARQITENDFLEVDKRTKLEDEDILITNSGTIGKMVFIKNNKKVRKTTFQKSVAIIKPNKDKVNSKYLYYVLSSKVNKLINLSGGSVQKNLLLKDLRKLEIDLPSLETQEKIASILSALDNKIELNNEMNKTLEEMAQTLFKRWFIDFDFPNENGEPYRSSGGKMVDSELGEIPEGWEVGAIKEIGEVITGKTPSTKNKENYGGKIPFITIPDMHGNIFITNTERYLSEIGNRTQSKKLLPVNSIIVSCIATVGLVSLNIRPSHTNQQINSIVPKSQNMLFYFFNVIKKLEDKLKMIGSAGTTTLNVNKGAFENIRIVFPNLKLMETYNNFVKNMYLKINENQQEIQSLIQIRDTLLPKLMSGEVEV